MLFAIETLTELIKTWTVAQSVAASTGKAADIDYAQSVLDEINLLRLQMAVEAEQKQIFYAQQNITQGTNANNIRNYWFNKNDRRYFIKRGIANLDSDATVSLLNQSLSERLITRDQVAWQQLFSSIQFTAGTVLSTLGSLVLQDLPQELRFDESQSLNIGVGGQVDAAGHIFLHGATIQDQITDEAIKLLKAEYINEDGTTKYLPETQLVPLIFQFASATAGTYATDPNGSEEILSNRNDRSVLLLGVSTTAVNTRIDKLIDEGKNQTICDRIEMQGVACDSTSAYGTYYNLPYPHILRKGDRLRAQFINGSLITGDEMAINLPYFLTFHGITL